MKKKKGFEAAPRAGALAAMDEDLAGVGLVLEAPEGPCSSACSSFFRSAKAREDEAALRVCGAEDLPRWCAGHGHMAPCVVKALAEGSASYACGGISPGDILISVDGVPVRQKFA